MTKTKLLLTSASFFALATSLVNAKEVGNHVTLDLSYVNVRYDTTITAADALDSDELGFGISYSYNFKFGDKLNFFPELGFDYIGSDEKDADGDPTKIDYKYGLDLNLGYEVHKSIMPFISLGVSNVEYELDWQSVSEKESDSAIALEYGIGVEYMLNSMISFNLEYEYTDVSDIDTPASSTAEYDAGINSVKFGTILHF